MNKKLRTALFGIALFVIAIAGIVLTKSVLWTFDLQGARSNPAILDTAQNDGLHTDNQANNGTPSYAIGPAFEEADSEVILRLLEEELAEMKLVLKLTDERAATIRGELTKLRLSDDTKPGQEELALQRLLSQAEFKDWQDHMGEKLLESAETYSQIRLRQILEIIPDLSEAQKDSLFQALASGFLRENPPEEEEILRLHLTDEQFERWSKSTLKDPIRIGR